MNRSFISSIKKQLVDPVRRLALSMICRLVVKSIKDTDGIQTIKGLVLAGLVKDGMERFQNYGMTSNPPSGSEAVVLFVGGNQDHGIVIACDNRQYRFKGLKEGEVALYTDEGDYIHFKRGNEIKVFTKTLTIQAETAVNIEAPNLTVSGDIVIGETSLKEVFNNHTHNETGDGGGITLTPNSTL